MNSTLSNITTIDRAITYCRLINLPSQIESQDRVLLRQTVRSRYIRLRDVFSIDLARLPTFEAG